MRKAVFYATVTVFMLASAFNLYGASLAGVTMPDTVPAEGKSLVLNGLGLRSEFMVKVYVAGLYLEQKSSDASAIIKADAPKRIVMQFLHAASKQQMTDAFDKSFKDNTPDAETTMKSETGQFLGALDSVKVGDQMAFTYVPGKGTSVGIGGNEKLTIPGSAFSQVLFSVWLGPKPPTESLKKGMLGH